MRTKKWTQPKFWSTEQRRKSNELVRRGIFRHFWTPAQAEFYQIVDNTPEACIYASRKSGKSFSGYVYACEFCATHKNVIVRYMMPQLNQAKDIIYTIYNEFKEFIPKDCVPQLKKAEATIYFPKTNSRIVLGGTKPENIESSRGPLAHLLILDECAAFHPDNFDYAIHSVLMPQLTTTGGKILWLTTPPQDPSHPFVTTKYPTLEAQGNVKFLTIDDNYLLTDEMISAIEHRYGGRDNPHFRREYLCELIADASRRVTPEFDMNKHVGIQEELVDECDTPFIPQGYIGGDTGLNDKTCLLFCYFDHTREKLVVLDEWVDNYKTLTEIAEGWKQKEHEVLFPIIDPNHRTEAVLDIWPLAAHTMKVEHGLSFRYPNKKKIDDRIAYLRTMLENDKILIHPRCKHLINDLQGAIWNENKTDVERNSKQSHADCLTALSYLVRIVNWKRRPNTDALKKLLGRG